MLTKYNVIYFVLVCMMNLGMYILGLLQFTECGSRIKRT